MSKFKTGRIVKLKSGGPKMTCSDRQDHSDPGKVHCQWFAGSKMEDGWFPAESLEVVDDPESKKK